MQVVQVGLALRKCFWLNRASKIVYLANNRFSFVYFSSQRTLLTEKEEKFCRRFILYTFLVSGGLFNVKILLLLKESIENKKAFQIQPTLRWRGNSSTYIFSILRRQLGVTANEKSVALCQFFACFVHHTGCWGKYQPKLFDPIIILFRNPGLLWNIFDVIFYGKVQT